MQCPKDQTDLKHQERIGIEIDFCPKCQGVWLDRGELDKIIERSREEAVRADPPKGSWETERVGTMPAGRVQPLNSPRADAVPTWQGGTTDVSDVETAGGSSVPFKDTIEDGADVHVVDGDERGVNAREVVAEEVTPAHETDKLGDARDGEPVLDRQDDKKTSRRNFFEELFDLG